jgi:glyoxylase-like metal-dependent hydrolase (beta-lactamase superfamily II)
MIFSAPAQVLVGDVEVIALTDAAGPFPRSVEEAFAGATPEDWRHARHLDPGAFDRDGAWMLAFRSYALRRPDGGVTVVDLGVGDGSGPAASWAPTPGRFPAQLGAARIERTAVDTVIFTHLHSDHVGWAVDPSGMPFFPNARHVVQKRELDHLRASGSTEVQRRVVGPLTAHDLLHAVDGPVVLTRSRTGGPRIELIPTPGHTPGHQSVEVTGAHHTVLLTGDAFVHCVQVANPEVAYTYEDSPRDAAATRRRLLERTQAAGATMANPHFMVPFVAGKDVFPARPPRTSGGSQVSGS